MNNMRNILKVDGGRIRNVYSKIPNCLFRNLMYEDKGSRGVGAARDPAEATASVLMSGPK
jgi:hypothetical protein